MSLRGLNFQNSSSKPGNARSLQAPRKGTVAALPNGSTQRGPKSRSTEQSRLTSQIPGTSQQRRAGISSSTPERNAQNGADLQRVRADANLSGPRIAPTLSKVFLGDWRSASSSDSLALADIQLLWKMAGSDSGEYIIVLDDGIQQTAFFKPSHRGNRCACLALSRRLGPEELAFVERNAIRPEYLQQVKKLIDAAGWKAGESGLNWSNRIIVAAEIEGYSQGYLDQQQTSGIAIA